MILTLELEVLDGVEVDGALEHLSRVVHLALEADVELPQVVHGLGRKRKQMFSNTIGIATGFYVSFHHGTCLYLMYNLPLKENVDHIITLLGGQLTFATFQYKTRLEYADFRLLGIEYFYSRER